MIGFSELEMIGMRSKLVAKEEMIQYFTGAQSEIKNIRALIHGTTKKWMNF